MLFKTNNTAFCHIVLLIHLFIITTFGIPVSNITHNLIKPSGDNPCENHRCENEGQCMTIVSGLNGNETKHAQCVCHDRWIGPRCEALLILSPRRITEFSVELRVTVQEGNKTKWLQDNYLKYTLQYWSNESDASCYKIPEITNITYEISDLTSGVFYHFCARTDIVAKCATNPKDPLSLGLNCIGVVTRPHSEGRDINSFPVLATVISIILLLSALTGFAVVFKCGFNIFKDCSCSPHRSIENCCRRNRKPAYDLFVLPDNACVNVNNQTPLIVDPQSRLQNPQSLASLTQASVSFHAASPTVFPSGSNQDSTEQNQERMVPLISYTNTEVPEDESQDFIQIST